MNRERRVRISASLVVLGLGIQLASTAWWTPLTFVIFAMVGLPLVLAGIVVYAATVLRILKEQKAL